jgi:hypothetical protein
MRDILNVRFSDKNKIIEIKLSGSEWNAWIVDFPCNSYD